MNETPKSSSLLGRLFGKKMPDSQAKAREASDLPVADSPAPPDMQPLIGTAGGKARPTPSPVRKAPPPPDPQAGFEPGPPETTPVFAEEQGAAAPDAPKQTWLQRLASGLKRTSDQLGTGIAEVFTTKKLDRETLQELEDILISADLGIETATRITKALAVDRFGRDVSPDEVRTAMADEIEKVLTQVARPLDTSGARPFVILMVGVNGSGKTTTIGKLAQKLKAQGKSVLLAAGDTFRAAAVEQLQVWGQRTGAEVVTRPTGSDASGLAYDAVEKARAEGQDVLIIDTAGRLHNRDELMAELEKIIRVVKKVDPGAPHAVLLTLDATTGQNALNQVEIFSRRAGVTGLVMTKLDGTARGGILVAIAAKYQLPVHFIGVGEAVEDLEPFSAGEFAELIAGKEA